MADTVVFQTSTLASPPTGTTVASDDAGAAGQVQVIKLAISADGSATVIPADAANGLDVDVTRAPGTAADGGALPGVVYVVGGYDGVNAQVLKSDASGVLQVDVEAALPAGTNNIGDVDVLTLPAIALDATTLAALETISIGTALPAGTNNIGDVDVLTLPALVAGTAAIGKLAANSGVDIGDVDVTSLPAIPAGNNNIGDVDVASLPALAAGSALVGKVNLDPATTGGLSIATDIDLDETELEVKATAGQVYGWYIYNDGAAEVYVKLYNATAANVTVGTTTPVMTFGVPAGSAANVEFSQGIAFSTAICAAATTVATTADATAPAANQVVANFLYK